MESVWIPFSKYTGTENSFLPNFFKNQNINPGKARAKKR
jgi:hypothetical protein